MASIFSKLVAGEIPCYKLAETDDFMAFLDIRPMARGHALVIPKKEVENLFDLRDDLYIGLHVFAREIARAIQQVVGCRRVATAVIGLEIPHAHLHLLPLNEEADFDFHKQPLEMSDQAMDQLAAEIRQAL